MIVYEYFSFNPDFHSAKSGPVTVLSKCFAIQAASLYSLCLLFIYRKENHEGENDVTLKKYHHVQEGRPWRQSALLVVT